MDKREQDSVAGVFPLNGKAVSEVLGYVLILSIVVATVTVIYAAGMPAIRSQENLAVFRAMENTFYILQSVERLVAYNITPVKAVTVRAEGGSIAVIPDWGTMYVGINGKVKEYPYGAIVYLSNDGRGIVLDNGAILEAYGNRFVPSPVNAITPKQLILTRIDRVGNEVYISLINVTGNVSFSGQKTIVLKNVRIDDNESYSGVNLKIRVNITGASKFGWNDTSATELWINSIEYALNGTIKKWKKVTDWVELKNVNLTLVVYDVKVLG